MTQQDINKLIRDNYGATDTLAFYAKGIAKSVDEAKGALYSENISATVLAYHLAKIEEYARAIKELATEKSSSVVKST